MNDFLFYAAAFALVLGVLIVFHEFGHYAVARLVGVKVLRFSIGFGRPLLSRRFGRDGTEWCLSAFPLGGYVKMLDEREAEVPVAELPRAFNRQSVGRRMAIVVAGPLANLLLAVLLYWGLFWHGVEEMRPLLGTPVAASPAARSGIMDGDLVRRVGKQSVQTWQDLRWAIVRQAVDTESTDLEVVNPRGEIDVRRLDLGVARESGLEGDALERLGLRIHRVKIAPVIGEVLPGGVAAAAGLRPGDEIVDIDDVPVDSWQTFVRVVRGSPGVPLDFGIRRAGRVFDLTLVPGAVDENGTTIGRIGAGPRDRGEARRKMVVVVAYDPATALVRALGETWDKSWFTLEMIGRMVIGEVSWRNISGPVTIADYAGQSARAGLDYYLKFMALVSISLAVLNLLPIPILDGGHLLYYVAELLRRKPLSERAMEIGQKLGLALLLILMTCAFYNDINRLISG